jgi:hypothetical protein
LLLGCTHSRIVLLLGDVDPVLAREPSIAFLPSPFQMNDQSGSGVSRNNLGFQLIEIGSYSGNVPQ